MTIIWKPKTTTKNPGVLSGMQQVLKNANAAWKARAYDFFEAYLKTHEFLDGGVVYAEFLAAGNPKPHHPNCWGAIIASCAARGWMKKMGRHRIRSSVSRCHMHAFCRWRSLLFKGPKTYYDPLVDILKRFHCYEINGKQALQEAFEAGIEYEKCN